MISLRPILPNFYRHQIVAYQFRVELMTYSLLVVDYFCCQPDVMTRTELLAIPFRDETTSPTGSNTA
jgi:hypothetical protein